MRACLMICLLAVVARVCAQDAVIPIWPDGAPGAKPAPGYVEGVQHWNNDPSWPLLVRVKDAQLEVFRPKSNAGHTGILIFPGGGYTTLNIEKEGRAVARWLNTVGITAFVVKYRLPSDAIMEHREIGPLQDAQAAVRLVRSHARDWDLRPDAIGVMGFSAGGHVVATLSTMYSENTYTPREAISARPDFAILVYPLISMRPELTVNGLRHDLLGEHPAAATIDKFSAEKNVSAATPPTFIAHAKNDQAVPIRQSEVYAAALRARGVPVELHEYPTGNHGFALGTTPDWPKMWPDDLRRWLEHLPKWGDPKKPNA